MRQFAEEPKEGSSASIQPGLGGRVSGPGLFLEALQDSPISGLAGNLADGGMLVFDRQYGITMAYGQVLADLFLRERGMEGERLDLALGEGELERLAPLLGEVFQGRSSRLEVSVGPRVYECALGPVKDDSSQILAGMLVVQDVTSRRKVEEEIARMRKIEAAGRFAGGVAHDFNNILTVIMGNISMARIQLGDGGLAAKERLLLAEKAVMRAKGLTYQLLTFSKGGEPERRLCSITSIVAEMADLALSGSSVHCTVERDPDLRYAEVDEGQVGQVLTNLLVNAREAMPEGGHVRIGLSNERMEAGQHPLLAAGDYVRIEISDDGPGMPPHVLERIFEPYFTTKSTGSGLGLSIAYSVVRRHGGHIEVESVVGEGTTFVIRLPASESGELPGERQQGALLEGSGKVLLMDDERPILEVGGEMLRYLGYEVTALEDGQGAVDEYKRALQRGMRYDVVILDLTVPGGMGGREALRRILDLDPAAKVVVSSGYCNDSTMSEHQSCGFCASIPKPYSLEELGALVGAVRART